MISFFQWYFYSCLTPIKNSFLRLWWIYNIYLHYLLISADILNIFNLKKWFDKMLTLRQCAANFYVLCQVQNWRWTWSLKEDLTLICVKLIYKKCLKCYILIYIQPCIPSLIHCPKVFLQSLFEKNKTILRPFSKEQYIYWYWNTEQFYG